MGWPAGITSNKQEALDKFFARKERATGGPPPTRLGNYGAKRTTQEGHDRDKATTTNASTEAHTEPVAETPTRARCVEATQRQGDTLAPNAGSSARAPPTPTETRTDTEAHTEMTGPAKREAGKLEERKKRKHVTDGVPIPTDTRTEPAELVEREAGKQGTGKQRKLVTDAPMPVDMGTRAMVETPARAHADTALQSKPRKRTKKERLKVTKTANKTKSTKRRAKDAERTANRFGGQQRAARRARKLIDTGTTATQSADSATRTQELTGCDCP